MLLNPKIFPSAPPSTDSQSQSLVIDAQQL